MSVWGELRRRNVFRVAAAYLVASWLIVQVIGVLTDPLDLPDVLDTVVVVLLAIGFPFAMVIAWIYEVTPEGIRITSDADASDEARGSTGRRLTYVLTGLLVLAVGLMALDRFVLRPTTITFGTGSRLAILPCDDLSPDPTDSFFAVGIHEELLSRLGALSGLEVISRTSVQKYEGRRPSIPRIAADLNVDVVMECSARYAGNQVLLTAQVIDGRSDSHLWSKTYRADMTDLQSLFSVQADIATDVADTLRIEFLDSERNRIERPPTQSREAYEIVLKARQERSVSGVSRLPHLLELYRQAVTIDPTFAQAWVELATTLNVWAIYAPSNDVENIVLQRDQAVSRALAADPRLTDAHIAYGDFLLTRHDWAGAALAYDRARHLSPSDARGCIGEPLLVALGQQSEQVLRCRLAAVRNDPLSIQASIRLQRIFDQAGQDDEAEAEYLRILAHATGNGAMEYHALMRAWRKGDAREIDTQLVRFLRYMTQTVPALDQVVFVADDPDAVVMLLRPLLDDPEYQGGVAIATIATFLAHYGDPVGAVKALRRLYFEEIGYEPIFPWLPVYAEARRTPEFKALVQDLGMVNYWRASAEWSEFCKPVGDNDFECS